MPLVSHCLLSGIDAFNIFPGLQTECASYRGYAYHWPGKFHDWLSETFSDAVYCAFLKLSAGCNTLCAFLNDCSILKIMSWYSRLSVRQRQRLCLNMSARMFFCRSLQNSAWRHCDACNRCDHYRDNFRMTGVGPYFVKRFRVWIIRSLWSFLCCLQHWLSWATCCQISCIVWLTREFKDLGW